MKLILLGPPGCGKGTQAAFIKERYNIPSISTGDMIREQVRSGSELGKQVKACLDAGTLVSDELVIKIVEARLKADDCKNGYILDGFPRTVAQAQALADMGVVIDKVVDITLPDETIIDRISGRRVCPACGASYHITSIPSADNVHCDKCGADLIHRSDDQPEVVAKRLVEYREKTAPLTDFYKKVGNLVTVSSVGAIEDVTAAIFAALEA